MRWSGSSARQRRAGPTVKPWGRKLEGLLTTERKLPEARPMKRCEIEDSGSESGFRKLTGKERKPFLHAAAYLADTLRDHAEHGTDWFQTGVEVFDSIPLERRSYALLAAVEPLLGDAPPGRDELYAWN